MAVIATEKPKKHTVIRPKLVLKEEEFASDSPIISSHKSFTLEIEQEIE